MCGCIMCACMPSTCTWQTHRDLINTRGVVNNNKPRKFLAILDLRQGRPECGDHHVTQRDDRLAGVLGLPGPARGARLPAVQPQDVLRGVLPGAPKASGSRAVSSLSDTNRGHRRRAAGAGDGGVAELRESSVPGGQARCTRCADYPVHRLRHPRGVAASARPHPPIILKPRPSAAAQATGGGGCPRGCN